MSKIGVSKIDPVSAALLGVEHPHSLAHLRTLQQLPEVERIYLWDESEEALARVSKELPDKVKGTFTNLDELLAKDDLYFVIAALRNDIGKEVFIRCLDAGKHVMAEKPVGRNAAETSAILEASKRAGRNLGVCYQNRANAVIQEAKRIVASGALGPLMSVEMRMITTAVRFRKPEHWLFAKERAGGGMLSWLGCHYIDLMRYLTGDEIVSVQAEVATRSGENIDVEDVAALALRLKSGAIASLHVGYVLSLSGGGYHNSAGYDTYIGINGRVGRVHWSSPGGPTEYKAESAHPDWAGAPQWSWQFVPGTSPAYGGKSGEAFIRSFIAGAQEGKPGWATGEDALMVARVVDAAYESSRTGRRVEIEQLATAN
jgi:predicted dehydrogenase